MNKAELKRHRPIWLKTFPVRWIPGPPCKRIWRQATAMQIRRILVKTQIGPTKPLLPTLRIAAFLIIALLLAGAVPLRPGGAWGQAIFQFFNRAETNFMPGVTYSDEVGRQTRVLPRQP